MRYFLIPIIVLLILLGCGGTDDLETNSMSAAKIIREATNRLKTTKTINEISNGKIAGTEIYMNNTESKKYLKSNNETLIGNYDKIKLIYLSNNAQAFDALCVMAILNEYTFFLSMEAIDEPCTYARKLNDLKTNKFPSSWVLDDFYPKISSPSWHEDSNWPQMNQSEKFDQIKESLMVFCNESK